jgi:2-polyprenyl-3-methyl-5-hydroxy-6-metoxy-1,4-benzoquinol methylase
MRCIVCEESEALEKTSRHGEWDLIRCRSCGVGFWHPLVFVREQYTNESHHLRLAMGDALSPYHQRAFGILMEKTSGLPSPLSLLDIGCGNGSFLRHVAGHTDRFVCYGLDLNPRLVEHARTTFGDRVACADVFEESAVTKDRRFDVICFFEVLEHQPDPGEFIERVRGLLRPGGLVIGSVPNDRRYIPLGVRESFDYPPYHLTWWDVHSLGHLFKRRGMRETEMLENGPWSLVDLSFHIETWMLGPFKEGLKGLAKERARVRGKVPRSFALINSPLVRGLRAALFMPLAVPLYVKYRFVHRNSGRFLVFSARA